MTARSGQITVTTAGTAEAGPSTPPGKLFTIRALSTNVGSAYFGNDGANDVSSSTGFELAPNEGVVVATTFSPLDIFWFDVTTSGDGFSWIMNE